MSDLMLHGLGRGSAGGGVTPIEGLTPIIASDKIKEIGPPCVHPSLGSLPVRRGVNHYHDGKLYTLRSLGLTIGVTVYDATTGNAIADNIHVKLTEAELDYVHMIPDLVATDGSYYLAAKRVLSKYTLDGTKVWEQSINANFHAIAVEPSGVYVGASSLVHKYNRTTGEKIWEIGGFTEGVEALAVNSATVIVAGASKLARRLDIDTGSIVHSYTKDTFYALAIEPGTNHYYTINGSTQPTLRKHSFQTGEAIFEFAKANIVRYVYNLLIDDENNIYTISEREITKLDNQLVDFIWRVDRRIADNQICGFGYDREQGKIYVLRQHTARILSREQEWASFTPYQFEGIVGSVSVDNYSNIYGVGGDMTVRKLNALGKEQWVYQHNLALSIVGVDNNRNVYIADSSRVITKLNPYGEQDWSCSIPDTKGSVTGLVVDSEGSIIVGMTYWHSTNESLRADYLSKIASDGTLLKTLEIGKSGTMDRLELQVDGGVLASNRLYDTDALYCLRNFNTKATIFNLQGDFAFGIDGSNIAVLHKYTGTVMYSFTFTGENMEAEDFKLRAIQGLDGAIYAWDNYKTLIKFNKVGDEIWRYTTKDDIADVKVDEEHSLYLATGFHIEKLTQNLGVKGYDKN